MNGKALLKLALCVVALGVGVVAGSYRSALTQVFTTGRSTAMDIQEVLAGMPAFRSVQSTPRRIEDSEIEQIKVAKGANRWLMLLSCAERATAEDMAALVRSVGPDSIAIRMLAARWAELDPMHMFASIYADSLLPQDSPGTFPYGSQLGTVLFEEWAKKDLAGAVKVLTDAPDFAARESYRMTLTRAALKEDVEQGLRLMKEWQIRGSIPDIKKVTEWATRDPQRAAEIVVELSGDYSGQQALRAVGMTWAQTDPVGGLSFAAKLDPASRAALGSELIQRWAEKSPSAAAAYAASQSDMAYRSALGLGLVSTWSVTDPENALAWSQEHLRGSVRTEAVATVIRTLADTDLTAASQIVAGMDPGGTQNRACSSIFEAWFNKGPSERNAAFEWLASLNDPETQQMALSRVQWNGAFRDPASLRDFLLGPYGAMAPDHLVTQVASMQAANDPEGAMKWVETLPANRASMARIGILATWTSGDPVQAQAYVRAMPAGTERQDAVRTVSLNVVSQSIDGAAEWYRSLPAADQPTAMQAFQQISLSADQFRTLQDAIKE